MEVIERFEEFMAMQNQPDCPFRLYNMGYKPDTRYITPGWPLGTHTWFARIEIDGLISNVYADSMVELLQAMMNLVLDGESAQIENTSCKSPEIEILERFEKLVAIQNEYSCLFDLNVIGYRIEDERVKGLDIVLPRGWFSAVDVRGWGRWFISGETLLGLLQSIIGYVMSKSPEYVKTALDGSGAG